MITSTDGFHIPWHWSISNLIHEKDAFLLISINKYSIRQKLMGSKIAFQPKHSNMTCQYYSHKDRMLNLI